MIFSSNVVYLKLTKKLQGTDLKFFFLFGIAGVLQVLGGVAYLIWGTGEILFRTDVAELFIISRLDRRKR